MSLISTWTHMDHLRKCFHESNLIEDECTPLANWLMEVAWTRLLGYELITQECILEAHTVVTISQGSLEDCYKGCFRWNDQLITTVGGRACPRPYMVKELLNNWILDMQDWENRDPKKMHIRFEKIHPFVDGNGRVGRLLMWWHEMKLGKLPTLLLNSEKQTYYQWFQ